MTDNIPEVKQVFHGRNSQLLSLIDDVYKQISRIKDGKAPGDDNIKKTYSQWNIRTIVYNLQ